MQDSSGNSLPAATVMLLSAKDSIMQEFVTSGDDGTFKIRAAKNKDYVLQVLFLGLETLNKNVKSSTDDIDLGILTLLPSASALPNIDVIGEYDLMKIGNDTVEYNAKAFKVQPGAAVEDLLKRLPGWKYNVMDQSKPMVKMCKMSWWMAKNFLKGHASLLKIWRRMR
ncbi:MAG: hypothetical protein IPK94_10290 [Saprospiraceae bacterium]|nr:hypothetical protein [Saprospiraceae bacterium]